MASVLVVGATGILAPAAAALIARGDEVVGVAHSSQGMPEGVSPLLGDARDASLFSAGPWDAALVYAPAVTGESLAAIRAAVAGRTVLVRVSASADPALGPVQLIDDVLQLGWVDDGAPRWHTPSEISVGALAVLDDGVGRVLGAVRPWSDKP